MKKKRFDKENHKDICAYLEKEAQGKKSVGKWLKQRKGTSANAQKIKEAKINEK